MQDNNIKNQKGSVLLFALMLMLAISVAGVTLSVLLLNEIRAARYTDESVKAYYAAETGLERSLDYLNTQRVDKSATLDDAIAAIELFNETLSNNTTYSIDSNGTSGTVADLFFSLDKDKTKQLEIFNPSDTFAPLGVEKVYIDWVQDCADPSFNSRIEVSLVEWPTGGWYDESLDDAVSKFEYTCGAITPPDPAFNCAAVESAPAALLNYRMRIKSLDCDLTLVRVYFHDASSNIVEIPGRALVKSVGAFGNSEIALEANMPWWAPVTGLGDFVLFSETDIEK